MRFLVSFLLIGLLLSKSIYGFVCQINYLVNQKEITRLECENKNRPEMHCNGKCYLAKQLQKADEDLAEKKSENTKNLPSLKIIESEGFINHDFSFGLISSTSIENRKNKPIKNLKKYSFLYLNSFFHPPCINYSTI